MPLLDDFTYHWKMVMKFYVNKDTVCKTIIESTNIPAHLDQLLKVGWKAVNTNLSQTKHCSQVVNASVSCLGLETVCPYCAFLLFSLSAPDKHWDSSLN